MSFIIIRHYCDCENGENRTQYLGAWDTTDEATLAMLADAEHVKRVWADECGVDIDLCRFLPTNDEAELYDGDAWDHDAAVKWMVFDTDKPGHSFIY